VTDTTWPAVFVPNVVWWLSALEQAAEMALPRVRAVGRDVRLDGVDLYVVDGEAWIEPPRNRWPASGPRVTPVSMTEEITTRRDVGGDLQTAVVQVVCVLRKNISIQLLQAAS
jgi:hypothetical protein